MVSNDDLNITQYSPKYEPITYSSKTDTFWGQTLITPAGKNRKLHAVSMTRVVAGDMKLLLTDVGSVSSVSLMKVTSSVSLDYQPLDLYISAGWGLIMEWSSGTSSFMTKGILYEEFDII